MASRRAVRKTTETGAWYEVAGTGTRGRAALLDASPPSALEVPLARKARSL